MANVIKYESARWVLPFGFMGAMLPQECEFHIPGGGTGGSAPTGGACTLAIGGASASDASVETGGSTAGTSATKGGANTGGNTTGTDAGVGSGTCGNGILEPGEACDDQGQNGSANHCDTGCQFVCNGPCPLRVNPGAPTNGSGLSWQDPKNNVAQAMNQQSSAGGGEVWVLAGTFLSLTSAGGNVLTVPSLVQLRGGFAGTEESASQRPEPVQPTVIQGPVTGTGGTLLTINGSSDVLVERLQLTRGNPPFAITASQGVTLRDVTVTDQGSATISTSGIRIERTSMTYDSGSTLYIQNSSAALVDSHIPGPGMIRVSSSQMMWQRSTTGSIVRVDEHSDALLIDSVFSGLSNFDAESNLVLQGHAALVGSQVTYGGQGFPAVSGGSLLVFNSNFINLTANNAHGQQPIVSAIAAPTLEVSLSTFYNDKCSDGNPTPCRAAVTAGDVNNSLFVPEAPVLSSGQPPIPVTLYTVQGGVLPPSNCAAFAMGAFQLVNPGEVLATTHPCPDGGDATLLETSRQHLFAFATPFLAPPFSADLSHYSSPTWWQSETTVIGQTNDTGAPDPGAHFPAM